MGEPPTFMDFSRGGIKRMMSLVRKGKISMLGENQGNLKRNRNGNFEGRNNQDDKNKGRAEKVYQYKKCSHNHPGRDRM